ncbi:MAG: hypothetical protein K1X92_03410 [Bacteroidia bacterium]|nr:hypothetical protein [Bacteroidia bacterium]
MQFFSEITKPFVLCLLLLVSVCLNAQLSMKSVATLDQGQYLEIKVPDYKVFLGVKEPSNWVGDMIKAPEYYSVAMFYQNEKSFKSGGAVIKVTVYKKTDENTLADLEYDWKRFKKENSKGKQKDIFIPHSDYASFGKMAYVNKNIYEYITYLNPGREFETGVLVRMEIRNREATKAEWMIYEETVRSIHLAPVLDYDEARIYPDIQPEN